MSSIKGFIAGLYNLSPSLSAPERPFHRSNSNCHEYSQTNLRACYLLQAFPDIFVLNAIRTTDDSPACCWGTRHMEPIMFHRYHCSWCCSYALLMGIRFCVLMTDLSQFRTYSLCLPVPQDYIQYLNPLGNSSQISSNCLFYLSPNCNFVNVNEGKVY